MTLIDLTHLLIAAESEMIWCNSQANMDGRSISQTSMDMDNGNIGSLEKLSLPNGKGSALVNPVDRKVKRKSKSGIACVPFPKSLYVLNVKKRGIGSEAAQAT